MLAHPPGFEDSSNTLPLLIAMADHAAAPAVSDEAAIDSARHCLMDALGRGFEALREPECASQIAPIVPGALMPGGARVPGTSLELEPAQAAFCISLMLCRPAGGEQWPAPGGGRAADSLGGIIAVADYQARKALMEGKPPPKVRDVLAALLKTLEIQGVIVAFDEESYSAGGARHCLARVSATAIAVAQLGGTQGQILRAMGHACTDGEMYVGPADLLAVGRREWAWADTTFRAVRHACQAVASGRANFLTPQDLKAANMNGSILGLSRSGPKKGFGTRLSQRLPALQKPQQTAPLTARFRAAVDRYFPTRQAERIKALFGAPERLDDLPVNELIAVLVTNGAR
jgi:2-methylcitrate dehydratase PrpD